MSQTYNLYCMYCRADIWVGQGWGKDISLYGGDDGEKTAKFLKRHQGHDLRFLDEDQMVAIECGDNAHTVALIDRSSHHRPPQRPPGDM